MPTIAGSHTDSETRWAETTVPVGSMGRWALGLSLAAGVSWLVAPLLGGILDDATGSLGVVRDVAMPAAIVLVVLAAVLNALCLWVWRERSTLNIVAAFITIPLAIAGLVEIATVMADIIGGL